MDEIGMNCENIFIWLRYMHACYPIWVPMFFFLFLEDILGEKS